MKKISRTLILSIVSLFSLFAVVTGTFSWFVNVLQMNVMDLEANSAGAYFAYGNGSSQNPYGIRSPRHLYNLSWLQYSGFFNKDEDDDNTLDKQYYFELADNVNMDGWVIPPIGTERYPFVGNFNGGGFTISNITISNKSSFDQKPTGVTYDVRPEIVGLFGVVGKIDSLPYSYDTSVNQIYDFDIDTITVESKTSKTLIGLAAGYISGAIQDVEVKGEATLDVNGQTSTAISDITNNLSDYGLVGYSTKIGSRGNSYSQKLSEYYDNQDRSGGEDPSWGGSVNMKKMYNRLYDIAGNYASTNSKYAFEKDIVTKYDDSGTFERDALTGYAYTYRDREEGSFVFSRYSSNQGPKSDFMYLNGGTRYHQYKQTAGTRTGYYISYNGHYLGVSNGSIADVQLGWLYQNNILSTMIDGVTYYLTHDLTLSTSTQETWSTNGSTRIYYETGFWIFAEYHYITYDNGWTVKTASSSTSGTQLTLTSTTVTYITGETSSGADYMDYSGTNVTYFPLITEDDSYAVTGKNTGYVIGGSEDDTTAAYPDKTGDIRVSKYSTSDISNSYSGGDLTTVYTISSGMQTVQIDPEDYEKYDDSKKEFLESIDGSNIFGLHFMPANISKDHLVTAEYTLINGKPKTNYQMPASSIDFNLMEKGYINFFAGTYFSGNNSFFSLHHILRDSSNQIVDIKEILEIYSSTDLTKNYIYKYNDKTYSDTLTSDYSLAFSTDRIKTQEDDIITTNAVYYFEIPVNEGEYALGSVDGGTGAYLMYLDIGTNGGIPVLDKIIGYSITTITSDSTYPLGVDFAPVSVSGEGGDSIGIIIPSSAKGVVTLIVSNKAIDISDSSTITTYAFQGSKYTDSSPGDDEFNVTGDSPYPPTSSSEFGTRVLNLHMECLSGDIYDIRITDYLTSETGTYDEAESIYELNSGSGFVSSTKSSIEALSSELDLNIVRGLAIAATLTRQSGVGVFTTTYDFENCFYGDKIIDVDIDTNGASILIEVTTDYTFKIGGTTYPDGSIYS